MTSPSERARRWGVLPSYWSWQGEEVHATPEVEAAILDAMGAATDDPPALVPPPAGDEPCAPAPGRAGGWALQLYALRSTESWGIGDLADLRRFGRWARGQGASVLLLNPLGAQSPTLPFQPSPYYASSRRFRNYIYLRVEDVDGAERADIKEERDAALRLNGEPLVDYDSVFELKMAALRKVFEAQPRPRGLATYLAREGQGLRDFARFSAERDAHASEMDDPAGFHAWLQFHVDRQLGRAGREIGLITDVPVGFAPDGFDAARWRGALAPGIRIGVPPDQFFRDGQDWGLPAFDPWKLDDAAWTPFADAIRAAARHAAGVRLDHVMGLFRLYWIPDGFNAAHGAYVQYPAEMLLKVLAAESRRASAFVIGEDLGLVEPTVREHLEAKQSLSYRLVWFEESDPEHWPHDAVAAVGTHDLPTIAGIWNLTDPEPRLHPLRQRLQALTGMPDGSPPLEVALAVYARLAHGPSRIVLASLEDALGIDKRPNVPGTVTEMPNWRLALPVPIEQLETNDGALRLGALMRDAGRSSI